MLFLFCVLLIAVISDIKYYRIANWLIIVGMIGGLYYRYSLEEVIGLFKALASASVPLICLFPLFKIGVLGAGDIKLLVVVGCFLSIDKIIFCILSAFAVGAALSFLTMCIKRNMKQRFVYFFSYLQELFRAGGILPYYKFSENGEDIAASNIHFTITIFISLLIYWGGFY